MVHKGNGIINANINQGFGVGANSNYGVGGMETSKEVKELGESGNVDAGFAFVRDKRDNRPTTAMDNFQEYMKDKQEKAKEAGEDLATKEKEAKEQAKKVSQSMTAEEVRQLEMMGIDVDSANMTDIMGMVNTLRHNADIQETAELMAKIAVDKGEVGSMTMIGGSVSVGGVELDNVSVGDVLVAESKPEPASDIKLSDNEAIYLLKNNMDLSKENIYKAHFSGVKLAKGIDDKVLADMEGQLNKVIEQAGLEISEDTMGATKLLVNNDVPVTTDNLRKYMDMKPYMGQTPEEAGIPDKVQPLSEQELKDKALKLYEDVKSIDIKQVYHMSAEGKTVTIAAAVKYGQLSVGAADTSTKLPESKLTELSQDELAKLGFTDKEAVTAMRQMEEIRLSMTSAMAGKLIKMDMNVDTRELSKVVSTLKNIEFKMTKDAFYAQGVEPTEDNISLYQEVSFKVNAIGKAPASVVAAPLMGDAFTIEGLHRRVTPAMAMEDGAMSGQTGQNASSSQVSATVGQFETVKRSYEAVGTAPRRDMGDSIAKAFSNVKDILNEMNLPVNYETERAVRILGYNQLEITEDNINEIIDYDRQVNDMLNTFYPEAVIGMIRDGINPLDVPIDELNKKIRDKNYNGGVTEAKNFATYLRDMERQGELTPEEREAYVGMYRVMDKLSRSGDREAGYLFANGSRLTVRNLITAMRSRKAAGVDVGIDDSFGILKDMTVTGKKMDAQIEGAFEKAAQASVEAELDLAESYKLLKDSVEEFMVENSLETSAVNIRAVNAMLNQPGSIYSLVSELLSNMKFSTNTKTELIDEETENMADSMAGEDVPVDIADFTMESILEHLRGSEEMSIKYEDLRANLTELMYQWGAAGTLTQMDIATIKTVSAGFNIMSAMAKQDKFSIPVETDQGTKVMNLTIKKNGANPGLVEVSMKTESCGEISVSLKSNDSSALVGQVVSDSSEGNLALKGLEDKFKESLMAAGYNVDGIEVGSVANINLATYTGITSEKLYQVSVAVVKAIAEVV
ncbi:MAG: hypothetical protein E7257_10905 [Lachnospiraceae bacterium]|nr:hypothetical protein [Lachnospiraceae bacterium]